MDIFKAIDSELALFAGGGGGILGSKILGWRTVGAVEIEKYPCGVLLQRQNDGSLDPFPIWTDIRSFTKRNNECRPYIRHLQRIAYRLIISGGFPCQDISVAGKGAGLDGENSGLWREYIRLVREIRPAGVYVENSPMLTSRGIDRILKDLAEVGYNAAWGVLGASDVGANHYRKRIWILAYSNKERLQRWQRQSQSGFKGEITKSIDVLSAQEFQKRKDELSESYTIGSGNGVAFRMDRTKTIGNGQVPAAMAGAFSILSQIFNAKH